MASQAVEHTTNCKIFESFFSARLRFYFRRTVGGPYAVHNRTNRVKNTRFVGKNRGFRAKLHTIAG